MRYFGINLGHDSSLVGFDENGKIFFYAQAERYGKRIKKYENNLRPILESFPEIEFKKEDVVTVCPCFLRDTPEEEKSSPIAEYDECIVRKCDKNYAKKRIGNPSLTPNFLIDHHLAHAISSWCFRENETEKLFLCYDGSGPWADEHKPYKSSLVGLIGENGFSVFYDHEKIPSSMPINHLLGKNSAGKLMGLSGYVDESQNPLTHEEFMRWLNITCESNFTFGRLFPTKENPEKQDLILFSKIYYHYINFIWEKINANIEKYAKGKEILIGGGTGLALEINTNIFNSYGNMTFGPPVDDSGLALGAAAFGYYHVNKKWPKALSSPSLHNFTKDLRPLGAQEPKEIAKLIFQNKIIGLIRGKAEAGPRALGFRSIFAAATDPKNLERVSQNLKKREFYRPLAPIVTEESFDNYFVGPKGKYMQYKCMCNKDCNKCLPSIVHKDYSARPQVVNKKDDPWLHEVLKEYGKLSGHECFINTSLNGKNKPICNSLEDSVLDFKNNDIEIIVVGEHKKCWV